MKLDFLSLEKAVAQLQKSFDYLHSDLAREDPDLRVQFRAATIQAFEFSYELAVRVIRRQLAQIVASPDQLHEMDFADLMRDAAGARIIPDAQSYMRYREMRNKTSHTYNVELAEKTVAQMDGFLRDMNYLLDQLRVRNRETD